MQLYWSLQKLPELSDLPKAERREVLSACRHKKSGAVPALVFGGAILSFLIADG